MAKKKITTKNADGADAQVEVLSVSGDPSQRIITQTASDTAKAKACALSQPLKQTKTTTDGEACQESPIASGVFDTDVNNEERQIVADKEVKFSHEKARLIDVQGDGSNSQISGRQDTANRISEAEKKGTQDVNDFQCLTEADKSKAEKQARKRAETVEKAKQNEAERAAKLEEKQEKAAARAEEKMLKQHRKEASQLDVAREVVSRENDRQREIAYKDESKQQKKVRKAHEKREEHFAAVQKRSAKQAVTRVNSEHDEDYNEWFKIDNAALIFVPSRNKNWTNQFRFACVLDQPVRPDVLQRAANDLFRRFPTMMVYLKAGLFWNYFEGASRAPVVREEKAYPCRVFDVKAGALLMRILYSGHRVSVEFFHGITDGNGGIVYMMSLLRRYFELCGEEIPSGKFAVDHRDLPSDEEKEDAFTRYAEKGNRRAWSEKNSVQLKSAKAERGTYYITHVMTSAKLLNQKAHEYGLTISEYLASCLMWVLRKQYLAQRKKKSENPLRLCVPVDLRRLKPSTTLRNFVLMYNIEHYPEVEATFDDVMAEVKSQFNMITPEYIQSFINKNVSTAASPFVRILPRPVKNFCLNIAYRLFGLKQSAMSFSNLGRVDLPEELSRHILRTEFILGPGKTRGIKASCMTVGDRFVMSFGSDCINHNVEAAFLRLLTEQGVEVEVDTNRRECND